MLRHNLILIYRNFKKFRSTFFINLVGLSASISCALLIYLWVYDELHFDKFHKKDEQLFQMRENIKTIGEINTRDAMPIGLADALMAEMPEVECASTVTPQGWFPKFILSANSNDVKAEGKFVGHSFFKMFSYELSDGNPDKVLKNKYSIVVSEQLAKNLFGTSENLIGKTIKWKISDWNYECLVSGVFKNIPANSSDQFDFVMPDDLLAEIMGFSKETLEGAGPSTYLTLRPGTDVSNFDDKVTRFINSHRNNQDPSSFFVTPYSRNYLYGRFENGVQVSTRMEYVKLFSLIAIFIVLLACINFMNLFTAKASRRLKEVGIKKAVGAARKTLIVQYFCESILMAFMSTSIAILMVDVILPQFNILTGKSLVMTFSFDFILVTSGLAILTGIIAGSYPAIYLSKFNAAIVLKGKLNTSPTSTQEVWIRKGLVIFQFALSILFIVSVIVIYNQIRFIQDIHLGYNKNNVLYFEVDGAIAENPDTFISELFNVPGVTNASSTAGNLIEPYRPASDLTVNGKVIPIHIMHVSYGLIETLGIEMISGRSYSSNNGEDNKIIFNQAALDLISLQDPIGKTVEIRNSKYEIVGVTGNFHLQSIYERTKPMALKLVSDKPWNIIVRIAEKNEGETIKQIEKFYKFYNPGYPFDYKFLDQYYQSQYVSENRVAALSKYFAVLAILISCLGLFGLAAFTAERRLKEIGIRKVLGSSEIGIIMLLSKEFAVILVGAIIIAMPICYFLAIKWLSNFAFSINLEWWYFGLAAGASIVVALLTVGSQAMRAARTNPTQCLKDE